MIARHYSELVNYFARALGSRDAAADVVQESYARVFAMESASGVIRDLRALLYRTGNNIVIDGVRRRRAEAHMLESLAVLCAREAPSTETLVGARQQLERLARRLSKMPERRCEAFVLVRIYGFSHAEAAEHMQVTTAAIEKHVVRAVCDCLDLPASR